MRDGNGSFERTSSRLRFGSSIRDRSFAAIDFRVLYVGATTGSMISKQLG
ncbi:hypothetical protein HanPSC8_Chr10g0419421 [Helianthus annuus]|nr:hypothetical protein HanPSC8_Chr10g0419421 [Helianthus annuus]